MIVIIDYGMGNVGSVYNMLRKLRVKAKISSAVADIESAERLILPGVGHFDRGMQNLHDRGLIPILHEQVINNKKKVLGICLGMQMMTKKSDEGSLGGLGWVDGETIQFQPTQGIKVPHMGWDIVKPGANGQLFEKDNLERFYFVHSYYVQMNNRSEIAATCDYGHEFVASFESGNIFGVQFHPEKSHLFGMRLLEKFITL